MAEGTAQRRLAAILAADVVSYSRLIGEDEEATLATLKSYRGVIDELIRSHDGRIVGSAGDSVIADFGRQDPDRLGLSVRPRGLDEFGVCHETLRA